MASPRAGAQTTQLGRVEANTLSILAILKANATQDQANQAQLLAALQSIKDVVSSGFSGVTNLLDQIENDVNGDLTPPAPPASAMSLLQPPITRRGVPIMNYDLKNDWVVGPVAIVAKDDEGNVVPLPDGVTYVSTVSDATMLNVVDNDGSHFTMNALKLRGTVTISHHDTSGKAPDYTDTVNIVEDLTPTAADSDFSDAAHTTQALPTA